MSTRLVLIGAGGHARDTVDVVEAANARTPGRYQLLGFVSELARDHGREQLGLPVLGGFDWFGGRADVAVAVAVGDPRLRRRLVQQVQQLGLPFATLVHPAAVVSPRVALGPGCIVSAGAQVTGSATVGAHVLLNLGCTVAHDVVLGDYCTLAPGVHVSGHVQLGEGCDVGSGAVLLPQVRVGPGAVIGAGAVVRTDLPGGVTAVGVPARVLPPRRPPA